MAIGTKVAVIDDKGVLLKFSRTEKVMQNKRSG